MSDETKVLIELTEHQINALRDLCYQEADSRDRHHDEPMADFYYQLAEELDKH